MSWAGNRAECGEEMGRKEGHCSPAGLRGQEGHTQHQPCPSLVFHVTERFPLRGLRQNPAEGITPTPLCHRARVPWAGLREPPPSLPALGTSSLHLQLLWGLPAHPLGSGIQSHLQHPLEAPSELCLLPHAPASPQNCCYNISCYCNFCTLVEQFPSSQP